MGQPIRPRRRWYQSLIVASAVGLTVGLLAPSAARAAETRTASTSAKPTWSALQTLNTAGSATAYADPLGGSLIYQTNDGTASGYPNISRLSASGKLGTPVVVPDDGPSCTDYGSPGPVSVMSNGDAIVVWYSVGAYDTYSCMAEYFSNGSFGPATFVSDGISDVSAQPGEALTSAGASVLDWSIAKTGALTATGSSATPLGANPVAGAVGIALDPKGSAVAAGIVYLDDYSYQELYTATRSASGTWATATELAASNDDANDLTMAASPDGRAIIGWEDWSFSGATDTVYGAIRTAGKPFTSATAINTLGSAVLTEAYTKTAAGPDGTLAVASIGISYTDSYSFTTSSVLDLVAPGSATLGQASGLPAFSGQNQLTEDFIGSSGFVIDGYANGLSLSAGDGVALVAGVTQTETAQDASDPSSGGRIVDQKVLAERVSDGSSFSHTIASLKGTYPWSGDPNPPSLGYSGSALDGSGNGVLLGSLSPSSSDLEYETQLVPPPAVSLKSKKVTATRTSAAVEVSCAAARCTGSVELEAKTTKLGTGSFSLAAGRAAKVTVALNAAGKKAFANAKNHAVKVTAVVRVRGGKTISSSVTVS